MNRILSFIIIVSAIGLSLDSFGQTDSIKNEFNRDSSQTILKEDFDSLVDQSISLLKTKKLEEITDEQHIKIMKSLNTISVRKLKKGRYEKLEEVSKQIEYTKNITKRYPDWIPNRGMGFYFPKLKMELYGTPMPYAIFDVKE